MERVETMEFRMGVAWSQEDRLEVQQMKKMRSVGEVMKKKKMKV